MMNITIMRRRVLTTMGLRRKILFILIFGFQVNLVCFANDIQEEKEKASLLYYISDLFNWPVNDSVATFNIGVLGYKPDFTSELKKIAESRTINNMPIRIQPIGEYSEPEQVHVMFVEKSYHNDIAQILGYCQKYHILQVTDQLENKRYTVVNFIEDIEENGIGFEVNKDNLTTLNIGYKDELLLYGGSLADLREMYKSTKALLEKEAKKVVDLSKDIVEKNHELKSKNASIDSLSHQIYRRKDTLTNLLTTIQLQRESLNDQSNTYKRTKQELVFIQNTQKEQLENIKEKEKKLIELDHAIRNREAVILSQSNTIELKDSTIESKNRTLLLLALLGSVIFLLGMLIYRAYFMKKRNNKLLEAKVAKRTHKLQEMNEDLQSEIRRRQISEDNLRKSERNYQEIFNSSTDAIFIQTLDGEIIDVNKAMLEMYGYKEKQTALKLTSSDLCSGKESYTTKNALAYRKQAIRSGKIVFDWQAKRNDGEIFWVEVAQSTTSIAGKECLLSIVRDIDEKKKSAMLLENYRLKLEQMVDDRTIELKDANVELNTTNEKLKKLNDYLENQKKELEEALEQLQQAQDQLVESEKMATIGILAAGVAHEINNPLNYIKGGVSGIKMVLEEQYETADEVISELMMGVDKGVDRASKIVSSLNHFSRQSEVLDEKCDIHAVIDNCLSLLRYTLKGRVEVDKDYTHDSLTCLGNEGKIHQVLLNIITNAAQAIEKNGNIWIKTGMQENNGRIFIQVRDSGSGIKTEHKDKITTPFFTTKEPGKGTGLGLSISKKIISDHKGELVIESEEGNGTSVFVYLPINN